MDSAVNLIRQTRAEGIVLFNPQLNLVIPGTTDADPVRLDQFVITVALGDEFHNHPDALAFLVDLHFHKIMAGGTATAFAPRACQHGSAAVVKGFPSDRLAAELAVISKVEQFCQLSFIPQDKRLTRS